MHRNLVVKERIKEIVDFATSESPLNEASKGWINESIFIDWGATKSEQINKKEELLNLSLFWNKEIASIIFITIFLLTTVLLAFINLAV